jgi:aminopeptidase N
MGSLGNTVSYMVSGFNSFEKIDEIETFFSTKDTSEYSRGLSGAIEKARVNAAQILRERTDIQKWVSITPA